MEPVKNNKNRFIYTDGEREYIFVDGCAKYEFISKNPDEDEFVNHFEELYKTPLYIEVSIVKGCVLYAFFVDNTPKNRMNYVRMINTFRKINH